MGFENQMTAIVKSYMLWDERLGETDLEAAVPPLASEPAQGFYNIQVVDVFHMFF